MKTEDLAQAVTDHGDGNNVYVVVYGRKYRVESVSKSPHGNEVLLWLPERTHGRWAQSHERVTTEECGFSSEPARLVAV